MSRDLFLLHPIPRLSIFRKKFRSQRNFSHNSFGAQHDVLLNKCYIALHTHHTIHT
jgi:hypothetical protein